MCFHWERRICFSFPLKKDEMAIMRVLKLISDATTTLFYLQFLMGFLRKSLLEWLFFKVEEEHHKVLSIFFLYAVYPTIFLWNYLFLEVSHLGNDAGHCYEDATWKRGPPAVQWECRPFQPRHKSPTHIPQLQEKQTYWKTIQSRELEHKSKKVPSSLLRCGSNSSTFILIWVHDLCEPSNRKPKS